MLFLYTIMKSITDTKNEKRYNGVNKLVLFTKVLKLSIAMGDESCIKIVLKAKNRPMNVGSSIRWYRVVT